MKYFKEDAKNELLSKYESRGNSKDISHFIDFLVNNIDSLLNLTKNNSFYGNLERVLEIAFGSDKNKFENMCVKITEYGNQHGFVSEASGIKEALTNMRNLVNGKIEMVIPNLASLDEDPKAFQKTVNAIVGDHYAKIQGNLKQEKALKKVNLLQQKILEDKKRKRYKTEDQEAYKFFMNGFGKK